jgi:hypothetical protein
MGMRVSDREPQVQILPPQPSLLIFDEPARITTAARRSGGKSCPQKNSAAMGRLPNLVRLSHGVGRRRSAPAIRRVHVAKHQIKQEAFDPGRRQFRCVAQPIGTANNDWTVFDPVGNAPVRSTDKRCIQRHHIHQSAESQLAHEQASPDRELRERYSWIYKELNGVIPGLSVNLDGACEIRRTRVWR